MAATSVTPRYRVAMSEVTGILSAIEAGDPAAADELLSLVYDELCKDEIAIGIGINCPSGCGDRVVRY